MFNRLTRVFHAAFGPRRGPGRRPEKHLPYYKFLKAASAPGCPVCAQVGLAMEEWFENLLYESANDLTLRPRFDANRGLCARHVRTLCGRREGDGLGVAVIHRNVLAAAAGALGRGEAPPLNEGRCQACGHEADAEARYAGLIADFLGEEDLRAALEASGGLCLRHASEVMRRSRAVPPWFAALHQGRAAALLGTLERYIASFALDADERRARQSIEEELAWRGIAELLYGGE